MKCNSHLIAEPECLKCQVAGLTSRVQELEAKVQAEEERRESKRNVETYGITDKVVKSLQVPKEHLGGKPDFSVGPTKRFFLTSRWPRKT